MNRLEKELFSGHISIAYPWNLPEKLAGPAVMFDVISASYNIIYLASRSKELFVVAKSNVLQALESFPDARLIGEVDDPALKKKLEHTFIANNNPLSIIGTDIGDKQVILITNNGTQTLDELIQKTDSPVIIGHYTNISAITGWLRQNTEPNQTINLTPSGGREKIFAHDPNLKEDLYCAEATRDLLLGITPDFAAYIQNTAESIIQQYPQNDISAQLFDLLFNSIDKYPIVPICQRQTNGLLKIICKN